MRKYRIDATCGSSTHVFFVTAFSVFHATLLANEKIHKDDRILKVTKLWQTALTK